MRDQSCSWRAPKNSAGIDEEGERYAIWTFSYFSDTSLGSLGRWVCVFPRRRIPDSPVADFRRDFVDHSLVYGQRQNRLSRAASARDACAAALA
jgi:hypothetical protein